MPRFRHFLPALWLAVLPPAVLADQTAVSDERITDLRVSPWGAEAFAIKTTNATGSLLCPGQWIVFNRNNFTGSHAQETYDRSFSVALAAMSAGKKIFAMASSDCTTGKILGYIE